MNTNQFYKLGLTTPALKLNPLAQVIGEVKIISTRKMSRMLLGELKQDWRICRGN